MGFFVQLRRSSGSSPYVGSRRIQKKKALFRSFLTYAIQKPLYDTGLIPGAIPNGNAEIEDVSFSLQIKSIRSIDYSIPKTWAIADNCTLFFEQELYTDYEVLDENIHDTTGNLSVTKIIFGDSGFCDSIVLVGRN